MLSNSGVITPKKCSSLLLGPVCLASRHAGQDSGSRIMTWIIAKTPDSIDWASIEASTAGSQGSWESTRPT